MRERLAHELKAGGTMKTTRMSLGLIALMLLATLSSHAQDKYKLPDLHTIKTVTLAPSYGCRSAEEFQKGYQGSALFLSDYAKQHNSPDLLFNGACGSEDIFQAATAGDDLALIADLGDGLKLENISAQDVYSTFWPHKPPFVQETKYVTHVPVKLNHTYAVVLDKSDIRGLFIFTVVGYMLNQSVDLRYAVKNYQVQQTVAGSSGFDWSKTNH
jgi:hypothetical protein